MPRPHTAYRTHDTRKTSRGELVRFCCYMGALSLQPGTPLRKMWQRDKGPKDIFEPKAMGRFGIGKNRFFLLVKYAGEPYPLNEVGCDQTDPWRYSRMPVTCFNSHMEEAFTPGWNTGPDESMCAFTGTEGPRPDNIPHAMFVERKPEPLGGELEDAACAQVGNVFSIEINEGKERMAEKDYIAEYGPTVACSLRLSKGLHTA